MVLDDFKLKSTDSSVRERDREFKMKQIQLKSHATSLSKTASVEHEIGFVNESWLDILPTFHILIWISIVYNLSDKEMCITLCQIHKVPG